MRRYMKFALMLVIIFSTAAGFALNQHTTRAGVIGLPGGWFADTLYCRDGYTVSASGFLAGGSTTTVSVLSASPASRLGDVFSASGPGNVGGSRFFWWLAPQLPGTLVQVTIDRVEDGISVTGGTGVTDLDTVKDCIGMPYAGPALPAPGARNLVLIQSDTAVLNGPGGAPTVNTLKTCQTAFIISTSSDGKYGEVFVMGGWIPLSSTRDVDEDYGQPGGAPIDPACVGK